MEQTQEEKTLTYGLHACYQVTEWLSKLIRIFIFNTIIFPATITLLHIFPYSSDAFFLIHQTDAKADISLPTFLLQKPCNLVLNEEEF